MKAAEPLQGQIWLERRGGVIRFVKIDRAPAGGFVQLATVIPAPGGKYVRKPGTRMNTTTIERFLKVFEYYGRGL